MDGDDFSQELVDITVADTSSTATHALLRGDLYSCRFEDKLAQSGFYGTYLKHLASTFAKGGDHCYVGEVAPKYAPVIFSFRSLFYLTEEGGDEQGVPLNLFIDIALILQNVTRRLGSPIGTPAFENAQLTCIALSRIRQEDDKDYVDMWFQFPSAVANIDTIESTLYDVAIGELQKKDFGMQLSFRKSLKTNLYREYIPLYGSAYQDEDVPYYYAGYITVSSSLMTLTTTAPEEAFPIAQTALYEKEIITESMVSDFQPFMEQDECIEFWLPVILSVQGHDKDTTRTKTTTVAPLLRFNIKGFDRGFDHYESPGNSREILLTSLKQFIRLWNPWRLDQQSEWLLIGEAIFNIYEGNSEGITVWRDLTNLLVEKRKQTLENVGLDPYGNLLNRGLLNLQSKSASSEDHHSAYSEDEGCEDGKSKMRPRIRTPKATGSPRISKNGLTEEQEILNRLYDHDSFKVPRLIDITERTKPIKRRKMALPRYLAKQGMALYRKHYFAFVFGRNTIRSIGDNAREDSPSDYNKIHQEWCKSSLEDSTSELDTDIACAFWRFLWLDWMCETVRENHVNYFYMSNNRAILDRGHQKLKKLIVEEFVTLFYRMKANVTMEKDAATGEKKARGEALLIKIDKVISKLKSNRFKKTLINEAAIFFDTPGATSFFNENCELTCVNTGVLVAGKKGVLFRKGRLEDFITKRTAAFYLDDIQMDDPGVVRIMTWATETFLRKVDMIEWWFKFHSSLLRGGNDDKIFPFIWGEKGNEGKSAWTRFFEAIFGDYCSHVEMSYFTSSPKDANSATPVTASLKGVRAVWAEEAEDNKPIQAGPFKKRTGKDKASTRQLFQEQMNMIMQATFIGIGNDIPPFTNCGLPVKERLVIVPIRSQRASDAKDDIEEQYKEKKFKRDNFFDQDIEYFGAVGLWLLVHYYGKYVKYGLRPYPAPMQKHTDRYWDDKDKYYRFTKDMIQETKNDKDMLNIDELYEVFKEWHERMYPKTRIPNNDELRRELRNRWGKMKNGKFLGVKIKVPERKRGGRNLIGRPHDEEDIEEFEG